MRKNISSGRKLFGKRRNQKPSKMEIGRTREFFSEENFFQESLISEIVEFGNTNIAKIFLWERSKSGNVKIRNGPNIYSVCESIDSLTLFYDKLGNAACKQIPINFFLEHSISPNAFIVISLKTELITYFLLFVSHYYQYCCSYSVQMADLK